MIDSKHLKSNIPSSKLLEIPQEFGWNLSAYNGVPTSGLTTSDRLPNDFSCSDIKLSLSSADTTTVISVDILKNGVSVFEVPETIPISGTTSVGGTPFIFTSSATTMFFGNDNKIDFVVSGATDGLGLKVKLIGNRLITDPILDIPNLLVYLNASTITDGTNVLTTSGENVVLWKNQITGNGISGATQPTTSRQPTLQITNGIKEVKFDGTDDWLTFLRPAELDFQKTDSFTIVILTGLNSLHGYLVCKGLQTDKQYSVWLWDDALDGNSFGDEFTGDYVFGTTPPLPPDPIFVVYSFDTSDDTHYLWYNDTLVLSEAVTSSVLYPLNDTLIGARSVTTANNDYGYHFTGAIRDFLIFDRMLTQKERNKIFSTLLNPL